MAESRFNDSYEGQYRAMRVWFTPVYSKIKFYADVSTLEEAVKVTHFIKTKLYHKSFGLEVILPDEEQDWVEWQNDDAQEIDDFKVNP